MPDPVFLITGASGRIGAATARAAAGAGYRVVLSGRNPGPLRELACPQGSGPGLVATNVLGPALTARAVLPALVKSGGHLLLTGSVTGRVTRPGSLYSVTKWAVSALAASIRAECVGTGVRCTLVQPGLTDAGPITPERQADPMLAPADIAGAVMYAVSQPAGVDVSEIVIRPVGQDPFR